MSLTMENVYQILDILKTSDNCALNIDAGDIKISIVKGNAAAPAVTSAAAPAASSTAAPAALCAATPVAPSVAAPASPTAAASTPAAPEAAAPTAAPTAPTSDGIDEAGLIPITANVTSVFYRRPSPDEPPFVEVGDEVQPETCICLLEVMKCFRQVTADVHGRIAKILINNGDLVEAGTVMFLVKPL